MDQPGKVVNPARGRLNREMNIPLSPYVPENLVSRDRLSRPVPRHSASKEEADKVKAELVRGVETCTHPHNLVATQARLYD